MVITTPWRAFCVNLVGPYTLKGKDGSSIDFMYLTMINPETSWFEIVGLPTVRVMVPKGGKGKRQHALTTLRMQSSLTRQLLKSVI
jgi:hypothetical protein